MNITITDIAKMSNVSKATVSRVINNKIGGVSQETKERILKIIQDVGYKPNLMARSIVTSETKTIGLIIPDIQNPFFPQMVRGVQDYAVSQNYTVFLCNSDSNVEKQQHYIDTFLQKRVDGLILTTSGDIYPGHAQNMYKQYNVPVVLLDRKIAGLSYNAGVFIDNIDGAYQAVSYLLKDNLTEQVAFLGGPKEVDTCAERFQGYVQAHEEKNIPIDPELVSYGEYTVESGYEMAEDLINKHGPVGRIFAASDIIAIGAIRALRKMHISIPKETEIIGFDNIGISDMIYPAITTMAQPIYDIGYIAAKKLIKLLNGEEIGQKNEILPTKLIVRETTKERYGDRE
jgi:LacI family transcriptional regulator